MNEEYSKKKKLFTVNETSEMLMDSLKLLEWVVGRVPEEWHHKLPNGDVRGLRGDGRSVANHIAHLVLYEQKLANPVLKELAEGRDGTAVAKSGSISWLLPETLELSKLSIEELLLGLREVRAEHINIVQGFNEDLFNHPITQLWSTGNDGQRCEAPGWVAIKTAQHTGEHTNSIFRFVLFAP